MTKWIFSFFLFNLLFNFPAYSSHHAENCQHHEHELFNPQGLVNGRVLQAQDSEFVSNDSILTNRLVVKAMEIEGFQGESLTKLRQAMALLERIVNSEEFKSRVINFINRDNRRAFASSMGLSNEQIFQSFMEGREVLQSETPGEMNFFLKLYNNRFSKVIGWTNGSINTININWKFFKNFGLHEVAGNLAHEWCHKLGFGHESAAEHDSVPYGIGYIVRELGEKLTKGKKLN